MIAFHPLVNVLVSLTLVNPQAADESARAAAIRFAIEGAPVGQRLELLPTNLIIARETEFAAYSLDRNRTGPKMSVAEEAQDADRIVNVLGKNAKTGAAADYLECIRYDCATSGPSAVLIVRQAALFEDGYRVSVSLWLPGADGTRATRTLQGGIVMVERRGSGWAGVGIKAWSPPHPTRIPPE